MANSIPFHDSTEHLKKLIDDDAMRSISFRIHVSDYGRLRFLSKKLRIRNSEVFRLLVRIALEHLAPLYDESTTEESRLVLLATLGPQLASYFNYDAAALKAKFRWRSADGQFLVEDEDFELVATCGVSNNLVKRRLEGILGLDIAIEDLHDVLHDYLIEKYLPGHSGRGQ